MRGHDVAACCCCFLYLQTKRSELSSDKGANGEHQITMQRKRARGQMRQSNRRVCSCTGTNYKEASDENARDTYSGGQKSCPQVDFSVIFNKMAQQAVHLSFSRADTKFRGEYSKIFPKSIFSVSLSLSMAMCGRTSLLANIAQSTIRGVESTISHLNCSNPYRN